MLQPGTTLDNKYRIEEAIGRGGFGFVYRARERLTGEIVALKELVPSFVGNPEMVQRFIQEARATLRLTHPHIARTHTVFEDRGTYYLAMEYLSGGSLADRLKAGPLPLEEVVRIGSDLCQALAYAHSRGVVHCDIKPANVLFDEADVVRLADFGIAHVSADTMTRQFFTATGMGMGTVQYMAPEQLAGVRDDPRVDIYAMGVLLYRMAAGCPYLDFATETTPVAQAENISLIRRQVPRPLEQVNPRVPEALSRPIERALRKAPEERFGSAEELRAALQRATLAQRRTREALPTQVVEDGRDRTPTDADGTRIQRPGARRCSGLSLTPERPEQPRIPVSGTSRPAQDTREGGGPPRRPRSGTVWALGGLAAVVVLVGGGLALRGLSRSNLGAAPLPTVTLRSTSTPAPSAAATGARSTPTAAPTVTATRIPPTETRRPTPTRTAALTKAGDTATRSIDDGTMVYVPGGEFEMGDDGKGETMRPAHPVELSPFLLDRTEVTNRQYALFLSEEGNQQEEGAAWLGLDGADALIIREGGRFQPKSGFADHPVVNVTWYGAAAYCEWAESRLPTEAEWEYAAQGERGYEYPWGDEFDCRRGNFDDSAAGNDSVAEGVDEGCDGYDRTAPVGSFPEGASWCGALDMAGNVFEWVADWACYYTADRQVDPTGCPSGENKVQRGGSYTSFAWNLSGSARNVLSRPSGSSSSAGFRCARSAK